MENTLTIAEERLAHKSRNAAIISLAGFLIVLASIGYSFWTIHQLEGRKAELQSEIHTTRAELENLRSEIGKLTETRTKLQNDIQQMQITFNRIGLQLATGNVGAAKQVLATQSTMDTASKELPPLVYIQLRSEAQRDLYAKCAGSLKEAGFRVPNAEILPDKGPQRTEVRYFREAEISEAEKIAEIIRKWPVGEVKSVYVRGYETSKLVKPHQFEVWFAPKVP